MRVQAARLWRTRARGEDQGTGAGLRTGHFAPMTPAYTGPCGGAKARGAEVSGWAGPPRPGSPHTGRKASSSAPRKDPVCLAEPARHRTPLPSPPLPPKRAVCIPMRIRMGLGGFPSSAAGVSFRLGGIMLLTTSSMSFARLSILRECVGSSSAWPQMQK